MLRCLDLSDAYRVKSGGHPSDVIAPIVATADSVEANGRATIDAMAVAYEIYCSFCDASDFNSIGWDQPLYGVIAAAVGASKLLGHSREQMGHTIALALTPNMALFRTRRGQLSSWKGAAAANAGRNALFAATLAGEGLTGPSSIFEGSGGLWDVVGRFDLDLSKAGLARKIGQTNLKRYPVCYHSQSAIAAALNLRKDLNLNEITVIEIKTYSEALEYTANEPSRWAPQNRETADHSMPYVVAIALLEGEISPSSFEDELLFSPTVLELMKKIEVSADSELSSRYPTSSSCRMIVTLAGGKQLTVEVKSPEGHNDNPLSDDALELKFSQLYQGFGDDGQAQTVLDTLWQVDSCSSIRDILSMMATREALFPQ